MPATSRRAGGEWDSQVRAADLVHVSKRDLAGEIAARTAERAVLDLRPGVRFLPHEPAPESSDDPLVRLVIDGGGACRPKSSFPGPGVAVRHAPFATRELSSRGVHRLGPSRTSWPPCLRQSSVPRGSCVSGTAGSGFTSVGGRVDVQLEVPPPEHGESRLVFFGRHLREDDLLRGLQAAGFDSSLLEVT